LGDELALLDAYRVFGGVVGVPYADGRGKQGAVITDEVRARPGVWRERAP
jgi:hypothetical protein